MRDDPAIAEEMAQMQKALEVSYVPPEVNPPTHLRAAILEASTAQSSSRPRAQTRRTKPFSWGRVMNVAAAALIIGLSINNYRLWRALQASETEVQRLATLTYSLQATAGANQGSATLAVDPNRLEALLQVRGLPPLAEGKVYVLWTVLEPGAPFTVDDKGAILTNAFTVDAQGSAVQEIPVPPAFRNQELVTKVAITVEDAASPHNHKGTPILITGS
jgi:hypothetical protein